MNAKATGELIAACRKALEMSHGGTGRADSCDRQGGEPLGDRPGNAGHRKSGAAGGGTGAVRQRTFERKTADTGRAACGGGWADCGGNEQNARRTWMGALGALLAMALLAGVYLGYHYCTTVPFTNEHEANREDLAQKA